MSESKVHRLKTQAAYFNAVARGEKLFEVRKNDRFFQAGDIVELVRLHDPETWNVDTSAQPLRFRIGPILQGGQFGIEPGYCIFSLLADDKDNE